MKEKSKTFLREDPKKKPTNRKVNAANQDGFFIRLVKSVCKVDLVKEYEPFPDRKYRVDFSLPDLKIAIEKEGGVWMKGGGAHSRPQNIERDIEKYTRLSVEGWIIIRRQPKELNGTKTLELLQAAINSRIKP